ncbi:ROK family transcriptional regulator [Allostreptomyces psammosilenae]|uniref:Putative NBD/HSP70 family sugar kinase n=1 Tax=Allostreptomyces psammosilenae TaxID=1892865 RepID=A0A852ZZG0_9ACTN|nr:ROK family transcriptional regulator [Allostreptomyces psammosilenae]NYI06610.1 putative NBD/HSP70 family sugar kinase [Allostreptomyces psammosilenae]
MSSSTTDSRSAGGRAPRGRTAAPATRPAHPGHGQRGGSAGAAHGAGGPKASPKASKESMRGHNLRLVLAGIREAGHTSRSALAKRTGLTKATVSTLVEQLVAGGVVRESQDSGTGRVGRPATVLRLDTTTYIGLGAEINVDYSAACAVDLGGSVRASRLVSADNRGSTPSQALHRVAELAMEVARQVTAEGLEPVAATLVLPGPVSSGILRQAPNLGWEMVRAEALFGQVMGARRVGGRALPVSAENEADLAGLAELRTGAVRDLESFLYVSGEVGIGASLVVRGRVFTGYGGYAGELGHVPVSADGPLCRCGARGCLEQYAGQEALLRAAGLAADEAARAAGTVLGGGGDGLRLLIERAQAGDGAVVAALGDAGQVLGMALAGVVNMLSPQAVVLGGIYAELAPWMAPRVNEELKARVVSRTWEDGRLRISELGGLAAVRGAALHSLSAVTENPAAFLAQRPLGRAG